MLRTFVVVIGLLAAAPAWAVCTRVSEWSAEHVCINQGAGDFCVFYADLDPGSRARRAEQLRGILQERMDVRQAIATLPLEDPDRFIDPDRGSQFWGQQDGTVSANQVDNTYLIGRCDVVDVLLDDTAPGGFNFRFTVARL